MLRKSFLAACIAALLILALVSPSVAQDDGHIFVHGAVAPGNGLAFDPNGWLCIASVGTQTITVMNPETGEILQQFGTEQGVVGPDDLAFGPDGSVYWTSLFTGEVGRMSPDGEKFTVTQLPPGANPITFSEDGRLFVGLALIGDALYEIDPNGVNEPRLIGENYGGLNAFDFGPDGFLYSPRMFVGDVVRIDVNTGEVTTIAEGFLSPVAVKFDSQGRLHLLDDHTGEVMRLNIATGERLVLATLPPGLDNLAFNSEDRLFVSSNSLGFIVEVLEYGEVREVSAGGLTYPGGVTLRGNGDGRQLYVADMFSVRAINVQTGEEEMAFPLPATTISLHGNRLVASSWFTGTVAVFNYRNGEIIAMHEGLAAPLNAIQFHRDLIIAELGSASVFRLTEDGEREVLMANLGVPSGLAATEDDLWVADWVAGIVWQIIDDGETLTEPILVASGLAAPEGLTVTPGGNLLVVETGAGRVSRINLTTGEIAVVAEGLDVSDSGAPGGPPTGIFTGVAITQSSVIYTTGHTARVVYRFEPEEQPISSNEDVIGIWGISVGGANYEMALTNDGQVNVGTWAAPNMEQGTYTVEGNQIRFMSKEDDSGATYEVFVIKEDNLPVGLRFELVGTDTYLERAEALNGKMIFLAQR